MITDAPWYVLNAALGQDLQITTVKEEIHRFSTQYREIHHVSSTSDGIVVSI
jgi:hypothetical protein